MTNEAVKVELYGQNNDGDPRRYTCASGVAIAKNTLLSLADPRTAAKATTAGSAIAGISSMAKSATDYSTSISAWTNGIFELKASGAITVGFPVISAADATNAQNTVMSATNGASGAMVIGYALETASDADTINVRLAL